MSEYAVTVHFNHGPLHGLSWGSDGPIEETIKLNGYEGRYLLSLALGRGVVYRWERA